jgi:hypothetical protein
VTPTSRTRLAFLAQVGAIVSVFVLVTGAMVELLGWSRPSGALIAGLISAGIAAPVFVAFAMRLLTTH